MALVVVAGRRDTTQEDAFKQSDQERLKEGVSGDVNELAEILRSGLAFKGQNDGVGERRDAIATADRRICRCQRCGRLLQTSDETQPSVHDGRWFASCP